MLKPHLRLLLIQYSLFASISSSVPYVPTVQPHPLFGYSSCCYTTTSSPIPFIATVLLRYCTVQHHPLFLLVLLYTSVQRHVATVQTRHLFLMMLPPHPLFLMLLEAYNLVLNFFSCHSRQYNLTLSSLCYYNLILYFSI